MRSRNREIEREPEESCENCWFGYGIGGSCAHPKNADKADWEIAKPCGWYEPAEKAKEADEYEVYQNVWN